MSAKSVAVVCLLLLAVGVALAGGFDIAVEERIDVPAETVTVEGEEFPVSAIAHVEPGEEVTVHVDAPEDARYEINIYTLEQTVQDFHPATGDETATFDTDTIDPGSYVIAAVEDGEFVAVHPLVVADYTAAIEAPEAVEPDRTFEMTVTTDALAGENEIGGVELVVWNENTRERVTMTERDDGSYGATVDGLPEGSYETYAAVIADEQIDGQDNVIGLAEPQSLAVSDEAVTTPTETPTPSPTETPTQDPTPSPTPASDDSIITPNQTDDADGTGDGFGVAVFVLAVLGVALLARARES